MVTVKTEEEHEVLCMLLHISQPLTPVGLRLKGKPTCNRRTEEEHEVLCMLLQISQPLVPLVVEFAMRLFGELDYIQEGHSCEKFAKLYAHVPRIRAPGIHWSATASKWVLQKQQ